MQGYQYNVVYKAGKLHTNADSLSRREYENDADDVIIDPQVCSIKTDPRTEYTLEYTETNQPKINSLSKEYEIDKSDKLSEMICAIDAYETLDH